MNKLARRFAVVIALVAPVAAFSGVASAQQDPAFGTVPGEPLAPPPDAAPPAPAPQAAQGQWVETESYGWIWVPANAVSYDVNAQPYVYLYSPSYGWTWYVSPWGRGRYYAGPWAHARLGAPRVWVSRGWRAPPAHVVVRGGGYRGAPYRGAAPAYHGGGGHGGGGHHR